MLPPSTGFGRCQRPFYLGKFGIRGTNNGSLCQSRSLALFIPESIKGFNKDQNFNETSEKNLTDLRRQPKEYNLADVVYN